MDLFNKENSNILLVKGNTENHKILEKNDRILLDFLLYFLPIEYLNFHGSYKLKNYTSYSSLKRKSESADIKRICSKKSQIRTERLFSGPNELLITVHSNKFCPGGSPLKV